eukprot:m.196445 g.196445  ORF g.196445 m.196445 type:complete len:160 (+) comp10085_c5_seq1:1-480(+)
MQWKERGKGTLTILEDHSSCARLVFRRAHFRKTAANHSLGGASDLVPMGTTPNALTWTARDVSDPEDQGVFLYAVKFKTEKEMEAFRKAFNASRAKASPPSASDAKPPAGAESANKAEFAVQPSTVNSAPTKCLTCFCENPAGVAKCAACSKVSGAAAP